MEYNTLAATLRARRAKGCVPDVWAVFLAPIAAMCCITLALLFPRCLDGVFPRLSAVLVTPVAVPVKYTTKTWTWAGGTKMTRSVAHYAVTPIDIGTICILIPATVFLTRIKVARACLQRALPRAGRPCRVPCLCCRRRTAEFGVHAATRATFALILVMVAARIALLGVPTVVRGGGALLIVLGTLGGLAAVAPFVFVVAFQAKNGQRICRLALIITVCSGVALLTAASAVVLLGKSLRVALLAAWAAFVPTALLIDCMRSHCGQTRLRPSTEDTAIALLFWALLACFIVALIALPLLLAEPFYPCGADPDHDRAAGSGLGSAAACVRPSLFTYGAGATFEAWAASIDRDWEPAAQLFALNRSDSLGGAHPPSTSSLAGIVLTVGESSEWQDGLGGWCERWLLPVAWLIWLLPISTLISLRAWARMKDDDRRLLGFAFEETESR